MPVALKACRSNPRFVGDPIDVVTGANTDAPVDLVQRGPIPFQWVRYYSSARSKTHGSLGWGHSHDFDCLLHRDLDGLRYEDPLGGAVGFQDLDVGESAAAGGMLLSRTREYTFVISQPGQPDQEFEFLRGSDSARLARLRQGQNTIELRYTGSDSLREIIDSHGRLISVTSDQAGRVVQIALVDPITRNLGQILLAYEYDIAGNLVRATDVYKTTLTFAYDVAHRMTRRTDRRGYSFHFEYDDEGRCIHSRGDDGLLEVFLNYQPDAKTTIVRRGDGGQWIYTYNDSGAITQITDPYGNATKYIQDDSGRTAQEIDPNNNVTQLHYNWLGQHDYRIDPNGYVLPTKDADPDSPDPLAYQLPETPLEWEHGGLLWGSEIRRPTADDPVLRDFPSEIRNIFLDLNDRYGLDQKHESFELTEDQIPPTEDEQGRPVEQGSPGYSQYWKYDPNGNVAEHQDRDGAVFRYVYRSWNGLHQEIDPLGHTTIFHQSSQGLVNRVEDPGGTVTEYIYDQRDRLVEIRCNGIVQERYGYDGAANLVKKADGQGRTLVTWKVGPANLDTVRRLESGETHTFEYDTRGRIIGAVTPDGAATFSFADDGEWLEDKRDDIGVTHEFELRQLVSTTCFGKFRTVYKIGENGDLGITDPTGTRHRVRASDDGGLVAKHLANGARELSLYDAVGRCRRKAVTWEFQYRPPWMRSFTYSRAGNLLAVTDTMQGTVRYQYDKAHRLAEEMLPDGSRQAFSYDPAGNLRLQPGLADVEMDSANRLWAANGERFTYNDRDHLSTREGPTGTTHYEYNELDMLVRCQINGEIWTASYDALCRRIRKTWRGHTTTYYWDDFRLAAEVRHDGSLRVYVYEDQVALVPFMFVEYEGLDAEPASGKRYYIFTNQIGAPIRVEDDAGRSCWSARLDPYGNAQITRDSRLEMALRFPGHYHDPETGLHYNRFRYFSPELGRYLQSDPAGQEGGINLYAYPANPLTDVDIDGLGRPKSRPSGRKGKGAASGRGAKCAAAAKKLPPGTKKYKDGSIRTPDGKFAGTTGKPPGIPGVQKASRIINARPGWSIHGKEISVRDADGTLRRYDLVARRPDGKHVGIEVKSGTASRDAQQRRVDDNLVKAGGLNTVGDRAAKAGIKKISNVELINV